MGGHEPYIKSLKHWTKYFSPDQILILFAEDYRSAVFEMLYFAEELVGLPHFDFSSIAVLNEAGFLDWGQSKSRKRNPNLDDSPTSKETQKVLEAYFAPYNAKLYRFIKKKFGR